MKKIRMGITEKEYHLKRWRLYHSESIKTRGSESFKSDLLSVHAYLTQSRRGKGQLPSIQHGFHAKLVNFHRHFNGTLASPGLRFSSEHPAIADETNFCNAPS